uniref:Uncharacterized protein n=1 Tax=Anguilla anguilla TaxID=7936 RepID=A0A0E9TDW5_ANGAN
MLVLKSLCHYCIAKCRSKAAHERTCPCNT